MKISRTKMDICQLNWLLGQKPSLPYFTWFWPIERKHFSCTWASSFFSSPFMRFSSFFFFFFFFFFFPATVSHHQHRSLPFITAATSSAPSSSSLSRSSSSRAVDGAAWTRQSFDLPVTTGSADHQWSFILQVNHQFLVFLTWFLDFLIFHFCVLDGFCPN